VYVYVYIQKCKQIWQNVAQALIIVI